MFDQSDVEAMAEATWYRCRGMVERKTGATWETISEAYRDAWRGGAFHALTALESHRAAQSGASRPPPGARISSYCAERWPEAHSFGYDPRCCRFPKSCSATIIEQGDGVHCTQKDEDHLASGVACQACYLGPDELEDDERDILDRALDKIEDHYVGYIAPFRYWIDPKSGIIDQIEHPGWPELVGTALPKADYAILYDILTDGGTVICPWGEDDTSFNIPDLRARIITTDQEDPAENGVWVASEGSWERP